MASRDRTVHHPASYNPEDLEYTPLVNGCVKAAALIMLTLLATLAGMVWIIKGILS